MAINIYFIDKHININVIPSKIFLMTKILKLYIW